MSMIAMIVMVMVIVKVRVKYLPAHVRRLLDEVLDKMFDEGPVHLTATVLVTSTGHEAAGGGPVHRGQRIITQAPSSSGGCGCTEQVLHSYTGHTEGTPNKK
jgi:hypothetical protein